ncbi:MAG: toll/interleukin-1 receptor domain-containing protein, partial [Chloroflexota bacterium]
MQHHVFLSYSRRDLKMMHRVRDDLRASGLRVWTDEGIQPGSISWKEAIESAICETGILVVLLSPSANDSRWVQREIDYAETQGKAILPLLVRGEPKRAVPFALAGSQFVDLRSSYDVGMQKFLRRCWQHLPAHELVTIASPPAPRTLMNRTTKRERRAQILGKSVLLSCALIVILLFMGVGLWRNDVMANDIPLSSVEDTGLSDTLISQDTMQAPSFVLLYTYDTLIVKNERESAVSLRDIRFESDTQTFLAQEWVTRELTAGRCVQVWDILFRHLAEDVAPADTCASRVAYRAT